MHNPFEGPECRPRGERLGATVAWLVIAAVVAFVAYRNWAAARAPRVEQATQAVEVSMAGRYAVGAHAVLSAFPSNSQNNRQLLQSVLEGAKTPPEQLRTVPVMAEVQGAPAALDELRRLQPLLHEPAESDSARTLETIYTHGIQAVSNADRRQLADELGWFGRLALTYDQPASDPPRKAVMSEAMRAFIAGLVFELVLVVILIVGIGLFTWALVRLIDGRVRLAYQPPPTFAAPFLEAFALYLAGYVGIGYLMRRLGHAPMWSIYTVDLAWVAFACAWPILRGVSWAQVRQGLGWHTCRGVFREMGAGVVGYLAGMPLMAVAIYSTVLLSHLSGTTATHPIVFEALSSAAAILGLYLTASVWAPVVEESMFRGALFNYLRARHRWLLSAALSAFIFAALHPQGWTAIPVLGMIGFIFAGIREWRGTTLASATAHALNNATVTTLLILTLG